jgi:catechol 2,3-dioxygenase-like lactoylglutathione lyase family enzyme
MRVDQIDQVTINVKNLEESVKLFSGVLGVSFLPPREVTVGQTRLRFAWSPLGLGLVESDPPEPEGFRAIGLKVENLAELKAKMNQRGVKPLLEVDRENFREAHYALGGVRFSIAEYPDPPPNRIAAVLLGSLLAEKKS